MRALSRAVSSGVMPDLRYAKAVLLWSRGSQASPRMPRPVSTSHSLVPGMGEKKVSRGLAPSPRTYLMLSPDPDRVLAGKAHYQVDEAFAPSISGSLQVVQGPGQVAGPGFGALLLQELVARRFQAQVDGPDPGRPEQGRGLPVHGRKMQAVGRLDAQAETGRGDQAQERQGVRSPVHEKGVIVENEPSGPKPAAGILDLIEDRSDRTLFIGRGKPERGTEGTTERTTPGGQEREPRPVLDEVEGRPGKGGEWAGGAGRRHMRRRPAPKTSRRAGQRPISAGPGTTRSAPEWTAACSGQRVA